MQKENQYTSLNDASKHHAALAKGNTKIWYQTHFGRNLFGEDDLDASKIATTHTLLGEIKELYLEDVFALMQGENWSPNGEANELISSLGLSHTSMSMGDIVQMDDNFFVVAMAGFNKLGS